MTSNPTIIVGEKPNKTRDNSRFSLVGNRTGDFVLEAIGNRQNIILTNVVNHLYNGKFDHARFVSEGLIDLINLIETHKPYKIITLGEIAKTYVNSLVYKCKIAHLPHPAYINRFFYSDRYKFIKQLSDELDDRVFSNTFLGGRTWDLQKG